MDSDNPRKALDLHLFCGFDDSGKQLANINITFELKPERIGQICQKCELKEPVGNDFVFKLDFVIQEGREKECLEYFENGLDQDEELDYNYDLSPLQNWFKRPKKSGKLELYETNRKDGKGGVTLQYRFYRQALQNDDKQFTVFLQAFEDSSFHPDLNINIKLHGRVDSFKKNRIKIKPDQIDVHLTSEEFRLKDVHSFIELFKVFGQSEEAAEIMNHPLYSLLKHTEHIQGTVKMASLGKMLELYEIGLYTDKERPERQNEHPEVIKGLFRSELRVTFICANKMAFVADCTYENEAVLMRLLTSTKKYIKLFD